MRKILILFLVGFLSLGVKAQDTAVTPQDSAQAALRQQLINQLLGLDFPEIKSPALQLADAFFREGLEYERISENPSELKGRGFVASLDSYFKKSCLVNNLTIYKDCILTTTVNREHWLANCYVYFTIEDKVTHEKIFFRKDDQREDYPTIKERKKVYKETKKQYK